MIKRLFRTWLRHRLYINIGDHSDFEKIFQWIYRSPILEWKLRIYCICKTEEYVYGWITKNSNGIKEIKYHIDKAESLLDFFHK